MSDGLSWYYEQRKIEREAAKRIHSLLNLTMLLGVFRGFGLDDEANVSYLELRDGQEIGRRTFSKGPKK